MDIPTIDDIYSFEDSANYALWLNDSVVQLFSVPWDDGYNGVVAFESVAKRNEYFNLLAKNPAVKSFTIQDNTYIKPGEPVRAAIDYNTALSANYVRVRNQTPIPGASSNISRDEYYHYFIVGAVYLTPSTTLLYLQLDIWQQFSYSVGIVSMYLTKGHYAKRKVWEAIESQSANVYKGLRLAERVADAAMMEPEPITPERHVVKFVRDIDLSSNNEIAWLENAKRKSIFGSWAVIITAGSLRGSPGTPEHPNDFTAAGGHFGGVYQGTESYMIKGENVGLLLQNLAPYPWILQDIISIQYIPGGLIDAEKLEDDPVNRFMNYGVTLWFSWQECRPIRINIDPFGYNRTQMNLVKYPCYYTEDEYKFCKPRFSERWQLNSGGNPKLLTSPYSICELNNNSGQALSLDPYMWEWTPRYDGASEGNCGCQCRIETALVPGAISSAIFPVGYNRENERHQSASIPVLPDGYNSTVRNSYYNRDKQYSIDLTATNQVPIVYNQYYLWMVQSRPLRQYAADLAGYNRNKALAQAAYSRANSQISSWLTATQANISQQNSIANYNNSVANIEANAKWAQEYGYMQSYANNMLSLNPLGMIGQQYEWGNNNGPLAQLLSNIPNTPAADYYSYGRQNINNQAAIDKASAARGLESTLAYNANMANASIRANNAIADNNYALASQFAEGDYRMAIEALNAQVESMVTTPPSVISQASGDFDRLTSGGVGICVKTSIPSSPEVFRMNTYFNRYGYSLNRYIYLSEANVYDGQVVADRAMNTSLWIGRTGLYGYDDDFVCYWSGMDVQLAPCDDKSTTPRDADYFIPETYRRALCAMFEQGISVYNKPENIKLCQTKIIQGCDY